MATIPQNFDLSLKKGDIGESIVKELLNSRGWITYSPTEKGNKAHAFDFFCCKAKKEVMIAEVKSKAKMNRFPATGINTRHYEEYSFLSKKYNLRVFLFFVDEHPEEKRIYGNFLDRLSEERIVEGRRYPMVLEKQKIILFPLSAMVHISKLEPDSINELVNKSQRNYSYKT